MTTMADTGITENSPEATEWSQVLLTPKGEGEYRFCVDYRNLNSASKATGFPLPRIKEIIQRIGSKSPRIFAKLDLTSGYHQMPLSKASRKYTAFRTTKGVYHWTRVPMGLKNAAGYFQQVMTEEVLAGLANEICEVYIDDCIIWAESEEELLTRIKLILQRCKTFNITINPKKCIIGLKVIEILGHTIDE